MKTMIRFIHEGSHQNARFPCDEKELQGICNSLKLSNDANTTIGIENVYANEKANTLLSGKDVNLDELNYFMKRMDGFTKRECDTFYAAAYAEKATTLADHINLTYNIKCYSLVDDFSDFEAVGKSMYLAKQITVDVDKLEGFDSKAFFQKFTDEKANPKITPYGLVYQNRNTPEQIYDGINFPLYQYEDTPITLSLMAKGCLEYLYLPIEQSECDKALQRLSARALDETTWNIEDHRLPKNIADIVFNNKDDIWELNEFAIIFSKMETKGIGELSNLIEFTKISTAKELKILGNCMYEFESFPDVHSALQYGEYMICKSGRFTYDENLEGYIDFARYGQDKVNRETGKFTENGYLLYYGYNLEMQNILNKTVDLKIKEPQKQTELKLYMPLKAITYHDENGYGEFNEVDFEIEVSASELVDYEYEIRDVIENRQTDDNKCRGMMEYYDKADTVNAKVQKYIFDVEEVNGNLMGVAILTLNETLDASELKKIKSEITGQASDGFGEGLEQCEIDCDGRDICVSLWGADNWSIGTAEELGINRQSNEMGGMSL